MTDATNPPPGTETAPPPSADVAALHKDLEAARTEANEFRDLAQRSRAEFANYKRRVERELAEAQQTAAARVLSRYLDVLDDFERALKNQPTEGEAAAWANGVSMIHRKFQNLLDTEGLARIEALGQPFDPALHEAIAHEDTDQHPSGHVADVLRPGYKLGDRVIRPALVKVAR